ncbi:uncharacterized protein LOC114526768 [Dendronephthya gigantea]|uniref:uncharacterized protein LOC114526768 n=1 Tax=Dendronephthya gigantea TaxID=151771 RepID=UPI00106C91C3|nr:uncharacterized protein LOC114526768 [Dendronephthya gigantea]
MPSENLERNQATASLQLAIDQLVEDGVPDRAINELKGGLARIINNCEKFGKEILTKKKLLFKRPVKSVVITSTDKTKRLIALDSERYDNMVSKFTIDTGNYKPLKRLNLPRTEQINFNKVLNKVANKYKSSGPKMYNNIRANIWSEPMPCPVYCLPKDHKEGDLKGRPIHAATDTQLSKYLAKQLNMLLCYVPAHLRNTTDFIEFISNLDYSSIHGFLSLDVCNLYGSIPLDDLNENTPTVFTVTKRFFHEHKKNCELRTLEDDDFETLVRLCLTSDNLLIGDESYKQKSGLAMGNNLAPSLAIIYMNELDSLIVSQAEGHILLKRYIDDYFVVLLPGTLLQNLAFW